ncbi:MAG: hypothetical protein CM15mP21_6400 [Hyphomicrobiales bacterium]|nr:MAG: hypothetical protein CM15mP21_6400 [Hyphomicrobiales bacterium]
MIGKPPATVSLRSTRRTLSRGYGAKRQTAWAHAHKILQWRTTLCANLGGATPFNAFYVSSQGMETVPFFADARCRKMRLKSLQAASWSVSVSKVIYPSLMDAPMKARRGRA